MQPHEFSFRDGFIATVERDHWMSHGPLGVCRSILAVFATTHLNYGALSNALTSDRVRAVHDISFAKRNKLLVESLTVVEIGDASTVADPLTQPETESCVSLMKFFTGINKG
jgi:hypothetical protein